MRKWIALGLAACMTVSSLTGCGSSKKEAETTAAESAAESTAQETGAETDAAESEAEKSEAAGSDLDKLVFTYVTSPLNVPTIIEKNQGIFEKDFGEMGISTEYAEITSGADQTQALASGDVQVLYAVGATSVILSAANGADIKVLNMYSRSPKAVCM